MTPKTTGKQYFTIADLTEVERDRARMSVHEAGHAVLGVLLGGVLYTSIVARSKVTGLEGLTRFTSLSDAPLRAGRPVRAVVGAAVGNRQTPTYG